MVTTGYKRWRLLSAPLAESSGGHRGQVWTDSVQKGDRPALDSSLGSFGELNEPHYRGYIETHVAELFEAHGLVSSAAQPVVSQAY